VVVIEKCSFCVQRLQEGKLKAKKTKSPVNRFRCKNGLSANLPTDAIVFGNVNNSESAISKMRRDNPQRTFYSIEQVHTLPNVNYLAKVRNREEEETPKKIVEKCF